MLKLLAVVVVVLACGCSATITRVDPKWDGISDPVCGTSYAPVAVDAIVSGGGLGLAWAASEDKTSSMDGTRAVILLGAALAVLFGISGIAGEESVHSCRTAKTAWKTTSAALAAKAAADEKRAQVTAPAAQAVPRGWFCSSSPTVRGASLCARDRSECERARGAAMGGVPDLEACTLLEIAWCFERDRCAPTEAACTAQRAASAAQTCAEAQ